MKKELIRLANHLDGMGFHGEANFLDGLLNKISSDQLSLFDPIPEDPNKKYSGLVALHYSDDKPVMIESYSDRYGSESGKQYKVMVNEYKIGDIIIAGTGRDEYQIVDAGKAVMMQK